MKKLSEKENRGGHWLNRNVFAMGVTSFLGDFSHEMATAVLPQFMQVIGASANVLGFIEGVADALSSFVKLGAGYRSDKIGSRKPLTVAAYFLTGISQALFAFAFAWPLILTGRVIGWLGRGIRGPLRDAMLADSVDARDRGKAFGFHRAGDTAGAVAGPLGAYFLLTYLGSHPGFMDTFHRWLPSLTGATDAPFRIIFLLTLIPGLLSVASIAFLVTEKSRAENHELRFWGVLNALPKDFRAFLLAVGLFGAADFAPTMMILRATTLLEPGMGLAGAARAGALLYLLRNVVYTLASFPIGAFSDRFSRTRFLAAGYGVAVICFLGFMFATPSLGWLAACFVLAGVFIAWEDTIEGVAVRDYVRTEIAGTAYGVLGVVNGLGDFVLSFVVGLLWTFLGPLWAFFYAVLVAAAGTVLMARVNAHQNIE